MATATRRRVSATNISIKFCSWLALVLLAFLTTVAYSSPSASNGSGGGNKNKLNRIPSGGDENRKVVGSTQESATLRRIKIEYKDAVKMGIAYNWSKGEIIKNKSKKTTASETKQQHPQYPLRLGPLSSNLRHWHFSFQGTGIYKNGIYHGRIILPKDYPATPPRVQLATPSGRFVPNHDIWFVKKKKRTQKVTFSPDRTTLNPSLFC